MFRTWVAFPLLLVSTPALAQSEPSVPPTLAPAAAPSPTGPIAQPEPVASPTPGPADAPKGPGPYFVHVSFGFNVWTHLGSTATAPSANITPGDTAGQKKVILFQQVGFGYWVHPNFRLTLTAMLGETVTGRKPTESGFTLAMAIPWLAYTNGGFFGGAGPMIGPRAFGQTDIHGGLFTCVGYGIKLGDGFNLGLAVQVPFMFAQRFSVAVTPALVLGKRF